MNFGWALTQNPNCIATDASTITVQVDGVTLGHPVYNQPRSDISSAFPGRCNSSGPVGYYLLDTTKLANGLHTIGWTVYDNAGNGDGIGSRFFNVLNSASGNSPTSEESVDAAPASVPSTVEIEELGRVELAVGAARGYLETGHGRQPLPVGSTLKNGTFYWLAGPGFLGEYPLAFERPDGTVVRVKVRITAKTYRSSTR